MVSPMIDRVLNHFVTWRLHYDLSASEQTPVRLKMFFRCLLKGGANACCSLVKSLQQIVAGVQTLLLDVPTVGRSNIQLILIDLECDPSGNGRHHVYEIAKGHRLLMRFQVVFLCVFQSYLTAVAFSIALLYLSIARSISGSKYSFRFIEYAPCGHFASLHYSKPTLCMRDHSVLAFIPCRVPTRTKRRVGTT